MCAIEAALAGADSVLRPDSVCRREEEHFACRTQISEGMIVSCRGNGCYNLTLIGLTRCVRGNQNVVGPIIVMDFLFITCKKVNLVKFLQETVYILNLLYNIKVF